MAFCSQCGKKADEGARFCAGCGAPVAPDAVESVAAEARRHRTEMRIVLLALGLVAVLALWLGMRGRSSHDAGAVATAPQSDRQQVSNPAGPAPSAPAAAPAPAPQPTQAAPAAAPAATGNSNQSATPAIDLGAVQSALAQVGRRSHTAVSASAPSAGSDRYPGSEPVTVNDASIPDIGIPVAKQVYTTTDPVDTVVGYYRQRYPEAVVSEMNGQKVIAIESAGTAKVIAVGSTGQETRIAIVQPSQ